MGTLFTKKEVQGMSIMSFREFPDVLRTNVNLVRPNNRTVADKRLLEERQIIQPTPVRFVEIASAVKNTFLPVVEFDIEFVAIHWLHRNYIVNDFHSVLNERGSILVVDDRLLNRRLLGVCQRLLGERSILETHIGIDNLHAAVHITAVEDDVLERTVRMRVNS